MKAIILAGGEGQRLRPLTKTRPKPLMRVGDRAIIDTMLERLANSGIKEIAITLGYLGSDIKKEIGDTKYGADIFYFEEKEALGTAGAVKNAESFVESDVLVLSGDALTDIDFSALYDFHKEKKGELTLALKKMNNAKSFGVAETDESGKIVAFKEKPPIPDSVVALVNCGIYLVSKSAIDKIPKNTFYDFAKDLFPRIEEKYGFVSDAFWCDIGSFSEYRRSNLLTLGDGFFIHPEKAEKKVGVTRSVIGKNTRVMKGARIVESVVGRHTRIGERSLLDGCILGDGVTVGDGVIIGPDTVVGDFAVLGDGAVIKGEKIEPYSVFMG